VRRESEAEKLTNRQLLGRISSAFRGINSVDASAALVTLRAQTALTVLYKRVEATETDLADLRSSFMANEAIHKAEQAEAEVSRLGNRLEGAYLRAERAEAELEKTRNHATGLAYQNGVLRGELAALEARSCETCEFAENCDIEAAGHDDAAFTYCSVWERLRNALRHPYQSHQLPRRTLQNVW
jgi:predicted  nucleic acid-binding Zn-ribbon protein